MTEQIEQVEDFAEQLLREAGEMQKLATAYKNARSEYAKCLNQVTVMIYKAGLHRSSAAFENKIPMLIGHPDFKDEAIKVVSKMNESEQEYKGLEMVLKAYQAKISGLQSIVKFMQMGEINAACAAKYGPNY